MLIPVLRRLALLPLLFSSLAVAATAPPPDPDPSLAARLDRVIDEAVRSQRIIGTVVVVSVGGKVVYQRAGGLADREQGIPMRKDSIFRLASMSKPLVSATLMKLAQDGVLRLDDPVTRWLPDFRPRLADGTTPVITLAQLLTHQAGLSYGFLEAGGKGPYHSAGVSDGLDAPGLSLAENLRRLGSVPLLYRPGERWQYSLSIDVLGGVIAAATHGSLPKAVRDTVLTPLRMTDTGFTVDNPARLATPYVDHRPRPIRMTGTMDVPLGEGFVRFAPARLFNPASYSSGGAGMSGTAGDFMKFLLAIRNDGAPILAPATIRQMMRDHAGAAAQTQGPGWGFGYGWGVLDDPRAAATPQSAGTIQWGGAYGHAWFFDPQRDIAVVALTNTTFEGMSGQFPRQVRDAVYGKVQ